jgi:hypothetical protein
MGIFGDLESRKFRYKILSEIIYKDKELMDKEHTHLPMETNTLENVKMINKWTRNFYICQWRQIRWRI